MTFCTAINCMDGRTQRPVIEFLSRYFQADHVDMITEPGPNLILSRPDHTPAVDSILARIDISVHKHHSLGIAIVGHHDCAGNPSAKDDQTQQTTAAMQLLRRKYPATPVIGLWVNDNFEVDDVLT